MKDLQFESGGVELLKRVEPLWKKLNSFHLQRSTYFKQHFESFTFAARQRRFFEEPGLKVRIDLAYDPAAPV